MAGKDVLFLSLSLLKVLLVSGSIGYFLSEGQRSSSRFPDWVFVRVLTIFEKISGSLTVAVLIVYLYFVFLYGVVCEGRSTGRSVSNETPIV